VIGILFAEGGSVGALPTASQPRQPQFKEIMIDSGAAEHVAAPDDFPNSLVMPSEGSRTGVHYVAANGARLPNMGEQKVKVKTKDGFICNLKFQSADVTRPILSVPRLTDSGHECVFGDKGGTITHVKSGQVTEFYRKNGVYVMGCWVMDDGIDNAAGFTRQAK
jgi:hypothetical protein